MNDAFYTYLLCLKQLGYQPYLDIKKLLFNYFFLEWNGTMYPKHRSGPVRDFGFKEQYQLTIPPNSLVCMWIDYDVRPVLTPKYTGKRLYLFLILDPVVVKHIKEFEASFTRRGFSMESCVVPKFNNHLGRIVSILALGWNRKYLQHVLAQFPEEDYLKLTLLREQDDPLQKYCFERRTLIPRTVVLDFSRIIRRECWAYWIFRKQRSQSCLAEFESKGNQAYSWTLAGEVDPNPQFRKSVTRKFFLEVMDPLVAKIKATGEPVTTDMATYVQDTLCLENFPFVYAYFKNFLTTPMEGVKRETYQAIGESLCSSTSAGFDRALQLAKVTPLHTVVNHMALRYPWTVLC